MDVLYSACTMSPACVAASTARAASLADTHAALALCAQPRLDEIHAHTRLVHVLVPVNGMAYCGSQQKARHRGAELKSLG